MGQFGQAIIHRVPPPSLLSSPADRSDAGQDAWACEQPLRLDSPSLQATFAARSGASPPSLCQLRIEERATHSAAMPPSSFDLEASMELQHQATPAAATTFLALTAPAAQAKDEDDLPMPGTPRAHRRGPGPFSPDAESAASLKPQAVPLSAALYSLIYDQALAKARQQLWSNALPCALPHPSELLQQLQPPPPLPSPNKRSWPFLSRARLDRPPRPPCPGSPAKRHRVDDSFLFSPKLGSIRAPSPATSLSAEDAAAFDNFLS